MRSKLEEIAALKEIWQRSQVTATQEGIDFLNTIGVNPAEAKIKPIDGKENGAVCMLLRDRLIMPNNKTGPCPGCGEIIQWRPYLSDKLEKLCAFCALRRTRGDA